jgi:nucleoside-diphosphate-sugar epimerase
VSQHVLITGAEGFIGSHVRKLFARSNGQVRVSTLDLTPSNHGMSYRADIRCPEQLRTIAHAVQPNTIIHLAARAEVVIPFEDLSDLIATNVNGTINVLAAMQPQRVVFASSCAVYGNATAANARPRWSSVSPLGAYGISKAAAEFACSEWVRKTGTVAVNLRFGNVVGEGCRGLVRHLVEHASRYPDGTRPARLRGNGRLIRDYVPVAHAALMLKLAAELPRKPASSVTLNVGSGRGTTNRDVAAIVQRVLLREGIKLAVDFSTPLPPGEALRLVLDPSATTRTFGIAPPPDDEVRSAIEEAALGHLATLYRHNTCLT